MGDTKRGRERNGTKKREQRMKRDISSTLDADESPPEPAEDVPDVLESELENVSVTRADELDSEAE